MKLQRLHGLNDTEGALYVFADRHAHLWNRTLEQQAAVALAGPFVDRWAAQSWVTAEYAKRLTDGPERELYDECWLACGGVDADPYLLYAIISAIVRKLDPALVRRRCGQWHTRPRLP